MTRTVREAVGDDADACARLHALSFEPSWSAEDFRTWLEREVAISAVVLEQDKAIAFGLAVAAGDEAELLTIATDPSARRSGAAKLLLRFMTAEALVRGASRWILEVARDNEPARQFYRSEEFREIGVRSGYYARPGARVDAIVMSRP